MDTMILLRALVGGLLFIVIAALVFWVVYSNNTPVPLHLVGIRDGNGIPLPFGWQGLPQGLWYVLFTLVGLIGGLILGWMFSGQARVRARQQTRRARQSERALDATREEIDRAKSEIDSLEEALKQKKVEKAAVLPAPKK